MRWFEIRFRGVIVASLAALSCACTSLASGSDTAEPLDSVVSDPLWSCLGQTPKPLPSMLQDGGAAPDYAVYAVPIFDFTVPLAQIPGLVVQACLIGDPDCTTPAGTVFGPTPTKIPAGSGGSLVTAPVYTVGMQYGTNGYLRMNAPGYLQTEYYLGGPLVGGRDGAMTDGAPVVKGLLPLVKGQPLTPIKELDADNLATAISVTRIASDAILAVRTIDCNGNLAKGVTLSLNLPDHGLPFTYLSGQVLSTDQSLVTDVQGIAGFANVPLSTAFVNVSVEGIAPDGTHYGKINVTIRKGTFTGTEVRPDTGLYGR